MPHPPRLPQPNSLARFIALSQMTSLSGQGIRYPPSCEWEPSLTILDGESVGAMPILDSTFLRRQLCNLRNPTPAHRCRNCQARNWLSTKKRPLAFCRCYVDRSVHFNLCGSFSSIHHSQKQWRQTSCLTSILMENCPLCSHLHY